MSKDSAINKIKEANAALSLAVTLYEQIKSLENRENDNARYYFDSLILIQTSIYHTLVLYLSHLLVNGEKHSISELVRLSKAHLELEDDAGNEMLKVLDGYQDKVKVLKENRDKRIAHFDKKEINALSDDLIEELLSITKKLLGELNDKALGVSQSYGIALSRGMDNIMKTLREQIERDIKK